MSKFDTIIEKIKWIREHGEAVSEYSKIEHVMALNVEEAEYLIGIINEMNRILEVARLKLMMGDDNGQSY